MACVCTSLAWIMGPPAESPSVRKMLDSSRRFSFFIVMHPAVRQLRDVQLHLARHLPRLLLDAGKLLADAFVRLDLVHELLRLGLVPVQPREGLLLHVLRDPASDLVVSQLVLGLALEHGVLQLDCHRPDHSFPHVLRGEVHPRVLVDGLQNAEAERGLVRAAVHRVLAVHEAEVALPEVRGVGEGELQLRTLVVRDLVMDLLFTDLLQEEVMQPRLACHGLAVVHEAKAGVEVGVVTQPLQDELIVPVVGGEDLRVRVKRTKVPVFAFGSLPSFWPVSLPSRKMA